MELNKAIEILEQAVNETSNAKIKKALGASHEKLGKQTRSFAGVEPDDVKKDNKLQKMAKKRGITEALSILEEMLDVANSIFERSLSEANPEAPTAEEIPPSTNKIKQTKKDKDTDKKTEVVSVADELFPYEGNAKQQMNQKILAKINDMIEGTATLEDLLQLVRKSTKKPVTVKEGWDKAEAVLEEIINEISREYTDRKEDDANDHSQVHLIRSAQAAEVKDSAAANYHRKEFDRAQKKIKDFHKKAEKHFEVMKKKKEDNV